MKMGLPIAGEDAGSIWRERGRWTAEEDAQILLWRVEGLTLEEMAARTGDRRNAYSIGGRMTELRHAHERDGVPFPPLPPRRSGRSARPQGDRPKGVRPKVAHPKSGATSAGVTQRPPTSRPWSEAEIADLKRLASTIERRSLIVAHMRALWPNRSEKAIGRYLLEGGLLEGPEDGRTNNKSGFLARMGRPPNPEPAPKHTRLLARAAAPLPGIIPMPFMDAERGRDCHWVVEAPGLTGFHVCGGPVAAGHKSYCAAHAARARGTGPEPMQRDDKEDAE